MTGCRGASIAARLPLLDRLALLRERIVEDVDNRAAPSDFVR
ncbi:MAG: hypothetical protein AB7P03_07250 [Kofleriaceae bacterium]